ncbi:MAG: polysaccharide deacetylase family protein, partial [Ruminiclostridium sp.]|nr:polysaccharide deacetylase family protein [Ruminiclostridium sp.]
MISLEFGSFLSRAGAETSPRFSLTSDDVFVFDKDKEKQYFKAKSGTYSEISAKFDSLLKEKNAFYKENEDQDKKTLALLKTDGSVFKEIEFSGDAVIYKKNVLLLLDKEKRTRCYYDREKSVLSGETCQISDYLEGYICFAEEKQIKLASVLDKNFLYEVKQFEKPLSDTDDPFVSLIFIDKNTVEVSYYTDQKELHSQKIDLSAFYKDYEDKKAKAAAAASNPKPKAPENTNKYEYISPSYSTANGIKPFAEIEAKIKGLDNTRKGYGWKGSENRQSYYSQYNAYATGNRNKNVVYLTFDEGYEFNENTTKILNILAAKNVKAVFFVTMDFAKKRPDLVKRMINEGHIVGNHSTTHPVFPDISLQ